MCVGWVIFQTPVYQIICPPEVLSIVITTCGWDVVGLTWKFGGISFVGIGREYFVIFHSNNVLRDVLTKALNILCTDRYMGNRGIN